MTETNFRALCAELIEAIEDDDFFRPTDPNNDALRFCKAVLSARTALAQPEPVAPTDEELTLVYAYAVAAAVGNKRGPFKPEDAEAAQLAGLRAVLARWGTPANNTGGTH
jgi:hypothetical protein